MTLTTGQGIARITFSLVGKAGLMGSGFHFTADTARTPSQIATVIANALVSGSAGAGPAQAARTSNQYEWESVDVAFNTGTGIFDGSQGMFLVGTNTNQPMPSNCSLLVRKRSGLGNRHGRGRMYLPPYAYGEAWVDGSGVIDSGIRATLNTDWQNFLANMLGDAHPVTMCVGTGFAAVTSLEMESTIATQRKRMR